MESFGAQIGVNCRLTPDSVGFGARTVKLARVTGGFDLRRLPGWVTMGLAAIASVGGLVAAAVNVASYGPAEWGHPLWTAALSLFPAIFLVFGPVVLVTTLGRVPLDLLIGALPRWVIVAGIVIGAYVFINFFFLMHLLPNSKEQNTASSQQLMYMARLFTGHEMLFFGVSAGVGYGLDQVRRRKIDLNAGPRDDSLERLGLPWPLARRVTLQTMLTAEECAQRLRAPIPQGFFTLVGRYGVRGEVTATGFRLELGGAQTSMVYAVGRFEGGGRPTFIRVFLTFKRWTLLTIAAAVVIYPVIWLVINASGQPISWPLLLAFIVFGIGGNLLFGAGQMSSLVNQIRRATGASPVSLG